MEGGTLDQDSTSLRVVGLRGMFSDNGQLVTAGSEGYRPREGIVSNWPAIYLEPAYVSEG